jgi:hypothetical protein
MSDRQKGLYIPPGYWRRIFDLSSCHVIGVLASLNYEESDYIRHRAEFEVWAQRN